MALPKHIENRKARIERRNADICKRFQEIYGQPGENLDSAIKKVAEEFYLSAITVDKILCNINSIT